MVHAPLSSSHPRSPSPTTGFRGQRTLATAALAAALLLLPAASARAVSVSAGIDFYLAAPGTADLGGSVTALSPIDYWAGDGNNTAQHQWENHLLHYDSQTGLSAVGPLQDSSGTTYGYPSDLAKIGTTVYGLDQYWGQIYTVDLSTGLVSPIGATNRGTARSSLAYDPSSNLFYTADTGSNQLLALDPATGAQVGPAVSIPLDYVLGMAFDPANSLLYMVDTLSKSIYSIDPANLGAGVQFVIKPNWLSPVPAGNRSYTELQFYDGKLYGMYTYTTTDSLGNSIEHAQLREIDLTNGSTVDIGSEIDQASLHSLLIESMPEDVAWTVVSGPGTVTFTDPTDPTTAANFSAPGVYELKLSAIGNGNDVFDTVTVTVPEPGEATLLLSGLLGLLAFGYRGRERTAD